MLNEATTTIQRNSRHLGDTLLCLATVVNKIFIMEKKVNQVETKENLATRCCTKNYCSHP
jgi:hypothetical protein